MAEAEGSSALLRGMAEAAGVDPKAYMAALQEVCGCAAAKPGHFVALLHVASKYRLDPLLKQIGLMSIPGKGGETPVIYVSFDGWMKCLVNHEDFLLWRHEDVWSGGGPGKGVIEAVTVHIYRKSHQAQGLPPFSHTEYLRECRRNTGPWGSHPARMLLERAVAQATRFCFGMYVPEVEEWEKAREVAEERGEVAAPSAPKALVPALPMHAQAVPVRPVSERVDVLVPPGGVLPDGRPLAGGPTLVAVQPDVTTTQGRAAIIEKVKATAMPEYSTEASLAADRALEKEGGLGELEFD